VTQGEYAVPVGDSLPKNQGLSPMGYVFTTGCDRRKCAPIRFPSSWRKWELMNEQQTNKKEKTESRKTALRSRFSA
jgi:hypothetical protein